MHKKIEKVFDPRTLERSQVVFSELLKQRNGQCRQCRETEDDQREQHLTASCCDLMMDAHTHTKKKKANSNRLETILPERDGV